MGRFSWNEAFVASSGQIHCGTIQFLLGLAALIASLQSGQLPQEFGYLSRSLGL